MRAGGKDQHPLTRRQWGLLSSSGGTFRGICLAIHPLPERREGLSQPKQKPSLDDVLPGAWPGWQAEACVWPGAHAGDPLSCPVARPCVGVGGATLPQLGMQMFWPWACGQDPRGGRGPFPGALIVPKGKRCVSNLHGTDMVPACCNRFKYRRMCAPQKSSASCCGSFQIFLGIYSHLTKYVHMCIFLTDGIIQPIQFFNLSFLLTSRSVLPQARTRCSASLRLSTEHTQYSLNGCHRGSSSHFSNDGQRGRCNFL